MPFSELLYLFIGLLTLLIAIMFSVRISYDNREPIGNAFGVHIVWGMVYLAAIAFIIALVGPNWIYPADFALAVLVLPSIIATYFMSKFHRRVVILTVFKVFTDNYMIATHMTTQAMSYIFRRDLCQNRLFFINTRIVG